MDAFDSNNINGNDEPSVHPKFSIAPAGNASSASLNDWLDLNDIFYDDFFPPGIDFEAYYEDAQSHTKSFEIEQRNQQNDSNNQNSNHHIDAVVSIKSELKPRSKTILIPPSMPLAGSSITQSNSNSNKGKASKLDDNVTEDDISDEDDVNKKSKKPQKKYKTSKLSNSSVDNDSTLGNDTLDDSQRIERRERNREHAKRSRIRKRVLLETLQDQLSGLREQNIKLRRIVVEKVPKQANKILSECTTTESDLLANLNTDTEGDDENMYADGQQCGSKANSSFSLFKPSRLTSNIASEIIQINQPSSSSTSSSLIPKQGAKILMEPDFRLMQSLVTSQQNFVLSDPSLPDNPIVYASDGFCRLSGYKRQDVLGRNCRFLQGPGTDQAAVDVIRKGVAEGRDISVCLLNYRADGSPFWNQFFLGALKDVDGQVVNYVGVQCAVNTIPISEMKDRVKKLPMPDDI